MEKVRLGRSGLQVSPICLGTWQLAGDWGGFDPRQAEDAVRDAWERGVNFFDTAQAYGFGASERLLGKALGQILRHHRDEVVLATKGGLRGDGEEGPRPDGTRAFIERGLDESLQALGVDHVELLQVHWPDLTIPIEETAQTLKDLIATGKVRHAGVSNFDVSQMRAFEAVLPVETLQPPYAMLRREVEQDELPYCRELDIGVLVYGPLAHGLLTGAIDAQTEFPEGDWRGESPAFSGEPFRRHLEVVGELRELARELGATLPQLAVAWTLANPAVHCAIVGSRNASHVAEAIAAAELRLDDQTLRRIGAILQEVPPVEGPTAQRKIEPAG